MSTRENSINSTETEDSTWKREVIERVPHHPTDGYKKSFVEKRRQWLSEKTGVGCRHISNFSFDPGEVKGNIENFVGVAQVPIGIVGPIKVQGEFANGIFYVPFATTEGAMVSTYQRGAIAMAKSGGARTLIFKDENHLEPVFLFEDVMQANKFVKWLESNFETIKSEAECTTSHGKLIRITPYVFGYRVVLDFAYETADAMGANMVNVATENVCRFIAKKQPIKEFLLRSNLTSEKKASAYHLLSAYGKQVIAETILPSDIVERYLHSSPEKISSAWRSWAIVSLGSGTIGMNAHFANGLAAIYIACGQDAAHVANGCVGLIMFEETSTGDLYASVKLSSLLVGTVGGGTALGTQRECLELLGCYGVDRAKKFAEIIAATLLAGEIGICAGITSEEFLEPHKRARVHTIAKAYEDANIRKLSQDDLGISIV